MQEFKQSVEYSSNAKAGAKSVAMSFLILAVLAFVPSGVFYFFGQFGGAVTSLAPGTIAASLFFLGLVATGNNRVMSATRFANCASLMVAISGVIAIHLVGSIAVGSGTEPGRAFLSVLPLIVMLSGGIALATLLQQNTASLHRAIMLIGWTLIFLTVLAVVGIQPPSSWEKPVFPFSEPSHLALALNPFLMYACVSSRGISRSLWIAGGLALAYAAQSLTMMAGMLLTSLICLPFISIVIACGIAAAGSAFIDLSYFIARLDLSPDTQNLSTLVYRQGWELVGDAMERTSGWGVGFQQLGYAPFRSASADVVYSILRNDANTRDGGFLVAKIASEFGMIGWMMILAYLIVAMRSAFMARRVAQGKSMALPHISFALCAICAFAVDMFVRDIGYFGGSVLLFICSLYILWVARSDKLYKFY